MSTIYHILSHLRPGYCRSRLRGAARMILSTLRSSYANQFTIVYDKPESGEIEGKGVLL